MGRVVCGPGRYLGQRRQTKKFTSEELCTVWYASNRREGGVDRRVRAVVEKSGDSELFLSDNSQLCVDWRQRRIAPPPALLAHRSLLSTATRRRLVSVPTINNHYSRANPV
ncbi:hypothetical protein J6590_011392 [Homalodisca vitripennis]|nr:hypothetical protein J6590_011392 [Homalodisca vitripennis]